MKNSGRAPKKQRKLDNTEELLESKFGYSLFTEGDKRLGWLLKFASSSLEDETSGRLYSCVDLYFVTQDGAYFKVKYKFRPYIYVITKDKVETDVESYLRRRYENQIANVEVLSKEDLDLKNHLSGLRKPVLKLSFDTVQQLVDVKKDLLHVVERNKMMFEALDAYESIITSKREQRHHEFLDYIVDLREYDVPYHVRFAIDNDVRCGQWYDVRVSSYDVILDRRTDLLQRADVHVCAFDIETTKLPLKFPDAEYDLIMMISYMVNGKGFLIVNRECVGEDIEDIEYTPKPDFEGCFQVTNAKNEVELLQHWFSHMRELKPGIFVTYNGDYFDWPFLESRAAHHGLKMIDEVGFSCEKNQGECRSKFACHLDCFAWVKRDSYLPQGSHGLKAVTKAKLGYDPLEVNPEDMVRFAKEKPQMMSSYSVSDAVSTYYLYMTYVHPFIFSLATIIPMSPDEVLRKGSGTLCEMLLMVQAFKANVICPNKHHSDPEKFYKGQLLENETYIGGHVKCLESGVFRSDLPTTFELNPSAYDHLIENLDRDLQYAIRVEGKLELDSVLNYNEVRSAIVEKLIMLRNQPKREECPLIYHLDVAAMYPNIILTNRLQPSSVVTDDVCTACDFNRPNKTCLRNLHWRWRGEVYMANRSDYYHLKKQIESEFGEAAVDPFSRCFGPTKLEQQSKLKERLKKYCQKAYKKVMDKPITELREAGICMRENSFYVDTVRSFRDRRYEYKRLNKIWKGKLSEANGSGNILQIQEARDMVVLYDSLQLAHKCILNSFYGYVMRKGARWYSMEMAGVVTYTGFKIIENAQSLIEKIGKPLELDTDGIWAALPGSFPENFTFKAKDRKFTISYPCVMLNVDVARNNTNDQYQTLLDPVHKVYETHSECSIEFEVDGPYKAMILPASKEEGKLIKKRYAVFNDDGTLAELKGFEIKRRGELKLIKVFQSEVFDKFLDGSTLEDCYSAVAEVAHRWLDLLDNQGRDIEDNELIDFISESTTMKRSAAEYAEQKSCALTTAKRLADFLGDTMIKDKGLRCQYIVASEPKGLPVSERAVPVAIFETDAEVMKFYLKKWCKSLPDAGIRSIIDWTYYKQRLSSAIQKIITIPAAMQKVSNPVPRVAHPDWLHKRIREKEDNFRQRKLADIFVQRSNENKNNGNFVNVKTAVQDMEDLGNSGHDGNYVPRPIVRCFQKDSEHSLGSTHINSKEIHQGTEKRNSNASNGTIYQAQMRKRRKVGSHKNGIGSFFISYEAALTQHHWQIIQIAPSTQEGKFLAWVLVDEFMLQIPITVPRVFYLNCKETMDDMFPGRRVTKVLPHAKQGYNLVEVITDEDKFIEQKKKLGAFLSNPVVEGIYETQVPLPYHAILQIGCVCKLDRSAKKSNTQDGWTLSDLQMKTTTECSYLDQPFSYFYLYKSVSEGRSVFIGYFPSLLVVNVIIISPYQNKDLSASFVEKQFRESYQAFSIENSHSFTVLLEYVANTKEAEKFIEGTINKLREKPHKPTVAVIECPNVDLLKSNVLVLKNFPCVEMPVNARDSQYPIVGWQQVAARTAMQRCVASSQWLQERIAVARYSHVPLGNLDLDWPMFTSDVFFSRALRDRQMVLWISNNGVPDLGGFNDELFSTFEEEDQPIVSRPGAYRKISIELKIHHLPVNALLKSGQINEKGRILESEQDTNYGALYAEQQFFDEAASSAPALRVLKQLVQRYVTDASVSGNVFADALLQHFYRWLCSSESKLHDPSLLRSLQMVMQKFFALLLADIQKLGATVIFADFSKVIIDTGKFNLPAAKAYFNSLSKTLQARELYEWILLEPVQHWHALLFMDQFNYGGIRSQPDDASETESEDRQSDIVDNWKIAEYLPKNCKDHFIQVVSEFLVGTWNYAKDMDGKTSLQDGTIFTQSTTIAAAEALDSCLVEYLKGEINTYFTDKLLAIVREMDLQMEEMESYTNNSQLEPASHRGKPAVEFIKNVCHVLALDENVQHEVLVLKRNLLKYIRLPEFAPEAEFRYGCPSFVLRNVICRYCCHCKDLDLCRDASLVGGEWQCPECGQPYDREVMENLLLQAVRGRERLYHLQDLVCVRCNQIKAAHLADQCACGGSYKCTQDASAFLSTMRILLDVAKHQDFLLLRDCISWILQAT